MKFNFINKYVVLALVAATLSLQSCNKDSNPTAPAGQDGFFIINEGGFGNGNTSISYYDRKADAVTNNIFAAKNGRPLGDQAESMTIVDSKGYIVVQNSQKIEVINADDFSSITTITDGIVSPRYFLSISSTKAYVSDWGADGFTGTVKVIDLTTNKVTKTIPTGQGANRMLKNGNLVYVTNSGGYGKDNTVKVIDSSTDAIVNSITVGDNPQSIQKDKNGNLWVLAEGALAYNSDFSIDEANSTKGALSKITSDNKEALRLYVDKITFSTPSNLNISPDGTQLYYTYNDAVYSVGITATALPTTPFQNKSYYGLAVDPFNGNIIGCDAPDFSSSGTIDVYNAAGTLQKTYTVGIGPNGCAFK